MSTYYSNEKKAPMVVFDQKDENYWTLVVRNNEDRYYERFSEGKHGVFHHKRRIVHGQAVLETN